MIMRMMIVSLAVLLSVVGWVSVIVRLRSHRNEPIPKAPEWSLIVFMTGVMALVGSIGLYSWAHITTEVSWLAVLALVGEVAAFSGFVGMIKAFNERPPTQEEYCYPDKVPQRRSTDNAHPPIAEKVWIAILAFLLVFILGVVVTIFHRQSDSAAQARCQVLQNQVYAHEDLQEMARKLGVQLDPLPASTVDSVEECQ